MEYVIPEFFEEKPKINKNIKFFIGNLEQKILDLNLKILSYGRIDWEDVDYLIQSDGDQDHISMVIKEFLTEKQGAASVYWANAIKYCMEADVKFIIEHINEIIEEDWDFWMVSSDNEWIIEFYHEGEVTINLTRKAEA